MPRRLQIARPRAAASLVTALLFVAVLAPAPASAAARLHPERPAAGAGLAAEAAKVAAYWTPARMRSAPPLGGPATDPLASASFLPVTNATVPPYSVEGRIFVRQGHLEGFCSGTAINSASRRLVLTAGHCVNTGPQGRRGGSTWSRFLEFVPAYTDGTAPFGAFIARRNAVFAPTPWVKQGNPNFDIGAVLTGPNESGVFPADAVGGVTIALDRGRQAEFQTFGYPGNVRMLQQCNSPAVGEDQLTRDIPGPPTVKIRCHWLPGASGGGWLTESGTEINGLTSYGRKRDDLHTYGPYFSSGNVGALVRGM
ncbi:MAG: trypsin-like serine peptidase [Solirubrobacterales bacterium]